MVRTFQNCTTPTLKLSYKIKCTIPSAKLVGVQNREIRKIFFQLKFLPLRYVGADAKRSCMQAT